MVAVGTTLASLLIVACSGQGNDSADAEVHSEPGVELAIEVGFKDVQLLTEQINECEVVVALSSHQFLCRDEAGVWFVDEAETEQSFIGTHGSMSAIRTDSGFMMVLDGEPYLFDGAILSPMELPVPVPVESMHRVADTVWMQGAGRLFRLRDGMVTELTLDEPLVVSSYAATEARAYLAVPDLLTLDLSGSTPEVLARWNEPVQSLAVDSAGDLWLVSGDRLYWKRGDAVPIEVLMPEPVQTVVGPGIWVQGETSLYRFQDGGFTVHPLVAEGLVGVDDYGRLLQVREGQLRRHSVGRPVVVIGLSEVVMVSETVTLLPSDPDSLDELRVWLNGVELEVMEEPYRIFVDPDTLSPGEYSLRFFTQSADGDSVTERPVLIWDPVPVAWPEVEAIAQEHCFSCHDGGTYTELSTAADWEQRIDRIIELVTSRDMPPEETAYLSDEEIIKIRGWKYGGFQ